MTRTTPSRGSPATTGTGRSTRAAAAGPYPRVHDWRSGLGVVGSKESLRRVGLGARTVGVEGRVTEAYPDRRPVLHPRVETQGPRAFVVRERHVRKRHAPEAVPVRRGRRRDGGVDVPGAGAHPRVAPSPARRNRGRKSSALGEASVEDEGV